MRQRWQRFVRASMGKKIDSDRVQCAGELRQLVFAVASCFAGGALANPAEPNVVHGSANFQHQGKLLSINNSNGAIIQWNSFSIAADETTRFIQSSAASSVLNRVIGGDPSAILGNLQSNGRVFLINPSGIVFGAGSRIDVAGLVASTLDLSNTDFLAGRMRFSGGGAAIDQAGTITTPAGGGVYLVAPTIRNAGSIFSPSGEIILAAGQSVEIASSNNADIRVEIAANEDEVVNVGNVLANSGRIGMFGGVVRQRGLVSASGAELGAGGRIVFRATRQIEMSAQSQTRADGAAGGQV
jgi:filamentous hemagglutinin family protein